MSETKTHWKKLTNPNYLGAYSYDDDTNTADVLTIRNVVSEMVQSTEGGKTECIIAYFEEDVKPMILNKTNCKAIQKVADSAIIENWKGLKVTIIVKKLKAFGEWVHALRVKDVAPTPKALPSLTPEGKVHWENAIKSLKAENTTLETIKKHYTLTETNQQKLIDLCL